MGYVGKDFLGYAFPGAGLSWGCALRPNPRQASADYLQERGFELPTVSDRYVNVIKLASQRVGL